MESFQRRKWRYVGFSLCNGKLVHTELSTHCLNPSSNSALDHQSQSRLALDHHMMSPNQQRRKTAQRGALPSPREGSGSLIVSWAETKRLPVREPSRIWWRTTSLFPFRETSSGAMAWVILVPFSIDRIGHFRGPWPFFFFFFFLPELDFILFEVRNESILGQVASTSSGHRCSDEYAAFLLFNAVSLLTRQFGYECGGPVFSSDQSAPLILQYSPLPFYCHDVLGFFWGFFFLVEGCTVKQ